MKKKRDNEAERIEGKLSKNERIERQLNILYDFRFNTVKSRTEYRAANTCDLYQPVTKFALNSFRRRLDVTAGITTSADNIRMILESDFAGKVHPIREYFTALPLLNPAKYGYINKLLNTVQVANPDKWEEYFTKWLVGVVANAMNDTGCQNHTCLVLTGDKQGQFKTWWLDNLCPLPLKSYLFTGKIDPQGKDIYTLIAEYLFINVDDQLKELNKQNENALKNLITTPAVKYRRPYDIYIEEYPHLASFMASVNGNEFLTDPTGSRRFLPFEVLHIDKPKAENICMDNVYSEVMYLYRKRVRYWFNDTEIEELHQTNAGFEVQTVEFEMLMQYFEKPSEEEENLFFMTTAQILTRLREVCPMQLSEKRLGEALRKAGFKRVQKRINNSNYSVYGYRIKHVLAPYTDNDYG
ncbi:virulence protein [Parabacteroides distasonis]|mgnify:FL=1|uniref:VapE domain-containing protein n=1 Tax=Parabacteroides distasonis TaxID=823 RepID=UPI001D130347|nr:VapE domain-containing protein [Parabacteroides distasonis]MCC2780709.1 virulence protein [Parabacteroides distasonis]MCQ5180618.1 virulence protein [Parabacteroides distasonis]WMI42691.1 VapE family protein [Parabacteroides distasonis]